MDAIEGLNRIYITNESDIEIDREVELCNRVSDAEKGLPVFTETGDLSHIADNPHTAHILSRVTGNKDITTEIERDGNKTVIKQGNYSRHILDADEEALQNIIQTTSREISIYLALDFASRQLKHPYDTDKTALVPLTHQTASFPHMEQFRGKTQFSFKTTIQNQVYIARVEKHQPDQDGQMGEIAHLPNDQTNGTAHNNISPAVRMSDDYTQPPSRLGDML
tara:strand:- start:33 stop:698 length:666 start_codon:yes stop_codon:yes gene_type:complete